MSAKNILIRRFRKFFFLVLLTLMLTACSNDSDKVSTDKAETKESEDVKLNEIVEYESETINETKKETEEEIEEDTEEDTEEETEKETEKEKEKETETVAEEPSHKKVIDTQFAKSAVNVRSGPSASYKRLGSLKKGQEVTRIGVTDSGWCLIEYKGQEAYVSGKYLLENKPEEQLVDKTPKSTTEPEPPKANVEKPKEEKPKEEKPKEEKPEQENVEQEASGTYLSKYADEVLTLVNQARANEGLSAVTNDSNLTKAANKRSTELVTSFSHDRPDKTSCFSVYNEYNVNYGYKGENIAKGQSTPKEVMNSWMNSEGHRKNILNENFSKLGVGVYEKDGTIYWTQLFGG